MLCFTGKKSKALQANPGVAANSTMLYVTLHRETIYDQLVLQATDLQAALGELEVLRLVDPRVSPVIDLKAFDESTGAGQVT